MHVGGLNTCNIPHLCPPCFLSAVRLSAEMGLPASLMPGDAPPPDAAARLSERVEGVRGLLQRTTEEPLVADAERK